MKAIQINELGPVENLKIVDVPVPVITEDEVLIKVKAAGIVYPDILMRKGNAPAKPQLPFIPGREVSGIIEKVGSNVKSFKSGMRVTASMLTGGYAEYAKTHENEVLSIPDSVSYMQGLVYHVNLRVAYSVYYVFGNVQPNDTILVHAASGGIGTLIMQIAKKRANNTIIALAETDEKINYCLENGADFGINYTKTDYVQEVLRITDNKGVDVSLNSIGGPTLESDPDAIKPTGRWAIYGYAAGKGKIDPFKHLLKSLTINVSSVYTYVFREEYQQAKDFLKSWLESEELLTTSKTFKLEEVQEAHRWLEEQKSIGKIALVIEE